MSYSAEKLQEATDIMARFEGWNVEDVLGLCLSGAIVAAKKLELTKLQVQELLVRMWDKPR